MTSRTQTYISWNLKSRSDTGSMSGKYLGDKSHPCHFLPLPFPAGAALSFLFFPCMEEENKSTYASKGGENKDSLNYIINAVYLDSFNNQAAFGMISQNPTQLFLWPSSHHFNRAALHRCTSEDPVHHPAAGAAPRSATPLGQHQSHIWPCCIQHCRYKAGRGTQKHFWYPRNKNVAWYLLVHNMLSCIFDVQSLLPKLSCNIFT